MSGGVYEFVSFEELSLVIEKLQADGQRNAHLSSYWINKKVRVLGRLNFSQRLDKLATLHHPTDTCNNIIKVNCR